MKWVACTNARRKLTEQLKGLHVETLYARSLQLLKNTCPTCQCCHATSGRGFGKGWGRQRYFCVGFCRQLRSSRPTSSNPVTSKKRCERQIIHPQHWSRRVLGVLHEEKSGQIFDGRIMVALSAYLMITQSGFVVCFMVEWFRKRPNTVT